MDQPTLTVIGAYRPQISAETWQEQWQTSADDEATKEHFEHLVLIEASVIGLAEPFDMGRFGQMSSVYPDDPNYMQVGYHEGLLSADGTALLARDMDCLKEQTGPFRFAVYLHFYDPDRPLLWQKGEVKGPPVTEMPARLVDLMPYCAI